MPPRVAIVADDLIWSTRLAALVRGAGAEPVAARRAEAVPAALAAADACVVDLTARAYDGVAVLAQAAGLGLPTVAVAQHDDAPLRRAARAAGATRVHPYRVLAERGERELGRWIAGIDARLEEVR